MKKYKYWFSVFITLIIVACKAANCIGFFFPKKRALKNVHLPYVTSNLLYRGNSDLSLDFNLFDYKNGIKANNWSNVMLANSPLL